MLQDFFSVKHGILLPRLNEVLDLFEALGVGFAVPVGNFVFFDKVNKNDGLDSSSADNISNQLLPDVLWNTRAFDFLLGLVVVDDGRSRCKRVL